MKDAVTRRRILRYTNGRMEEAEDTIVTEFPLTIRINGQELVTMVCTPEHIEDMVVGYLASEGVIRSVEDIQELWMQEKEGFAHVRVEAWNPFYQNLQNKRYLTSCCGMSRQGFVFANDALTAKAVDGVYVTITPNACFRLMEALTDGAATFRQTGGVHNAALCDADGIVLSRMDIGRHNALDKIYGYCLRNRIPIQGKIIAFSGRISSEILLKVAKIGCEIVLSKSAPTALALELAEELGITTVGFIRHQSLNVYTHPERIQAAGPVGD